MPKDIVVERWNLISERLRARFEMLTRAELELAEDLDDLVGRVHLATGMAPGEIEQLVRS